MSIFTFLALLLDLGKVEGNMKQAAQWLLQLIAQVKASLPPGAADYISPTVDELSAQLSGAVDKLTLRGVIEEFVAFAGEIGKGFGPPDPKAGLGV